MIPSPLEPIVRLLRQQMGIRFHEALWPRAEQILRQAMQRAGQSDPQQYAEQLRADTALLEELSSQFSVGETYFFREPSQFEFLRTTVLPELRQRRGSLRELRVWSAGCSSGEEAYSLAILLHRERADEACFLLGTDASREAIERAQAAVYSDWSIRRDQGAWVYPYLEKVGSDWRVLPAIRQLVHFRLLNLVTGVYPSAWIPAARMDVIFCRNVLIYLEPAQQQKVLERLCACLAPGGWLILASTDPMGETPPGIERRRTSYGQAYQRPWMTPSQAGVPPLLPLPPLPSLFSVAPPRGAEVSSLSTAAPTIQAELKSEADETIATVGFPTTRALAFAPDSKAESARSETQSGATETLRDAESAEPKSFTSELAMLRELAQRAPQLAGPKIVDALRREPFSVELHLLQTLLALQSQQLDDALQAVRRALYVDRKAVLAHFLHGQIAERRNDTDTALRAYRTAWELSADLPADQPVTYAEGQTIAELRSAVQNRLTALARGQEANS